MTVLEELQILADDERVKEPLVDELKWRTGRSFHGSRTRNWSTAG